MESAPTSLPMPPEQELSAEPRKRGLRAGWRMAIHMENLSMWADAGWRMASNVRMVPRPQPDHYPANVSRLVSRARQVSAPSFLPHGPTSCYTA